jgi:hypothetical protein
MVHDGWSKSCGVLIKKPRFTYHETIFQILD